MGLFSFLKKKEAELVKFSELTSWLNKKVEDKKIDQKISIAKRDIQQIITETRKSLDELEAATLINENIPVKEKQIMEGHRKTYLQKVRRFIDDTKLPDDFADIGHFNARFSESLNQLAQDTIKNYSVLKQFFESQSSRVAQGIKNLEAALNKLQSDIDKEGLELIKEAKIKLKQYHEDLEKKAKLERDIESHRQELENLNKKKEKLEAKIADQKKGREYSEFKDSLDEKKKIEQEISKIEKELITLFSEITRPLKKHTHNTAMEKIVDKYAADPAGALQDDTSLVIHEILRKVHDDLDNLDLKENQIEKTRELIEQMGREFFHIKKQDLISLKEKNRELASKINRSVAALNISENESWVKSLENKIFEWEKVIDRTTKELEEINLGYIKQKVKEKIHDIDKSVMIEDDS